MADGHQSTALAKAPISAGGHVAAIIPSTFDDVQRIAGALAASGLTTFKRQEEAIAAIMAGAEVGLPPFASLQSFMFVNGRLSIWGDVMLALVRSKGHKVEEWYEGSLEEGTLKAFTKATRMDTGDIVLEDFSIDDAKRAELWQASPTVRRKNRQDQWYDAKNDSPWFRYPKRMLRYRARGFALRDGFSDILRGIKMVEEVQDYPDEAIIGEARVIDRADEYDQRPQEGRQPVRTVIGGQEGKDRFDKLAEDLSGCEDAHALEMIWSEAEMSNLSANRMYALSEHYEACKEALENGQPCPAAPRFTPAPEPSPFVALNNAGAEVKDQAGFDAWKATLTQDSLGKCTEEERATLRATFTDAQARAKKHSESAGAGGVDEGVSEPKESGGASLVAAGAEAPLASSSFALLKKQGEDILKLSGKRRQGAALEDWRASRDLAKYDLTDEEAASLTKLDGTIAAAVSA